MANNACCKWLDFIADVRRLWSPELGEVDIDHARMAWGQYAATPVEYVSAIEAGTQVPDSVSRGEKHG